VTLAVGADARSRDGFWTVRVEDGTPRSLELHGTLDELLAAAEAAEVVAVDVPVGHEDPRGEAGGRRTCERAARELLGDAVDRILPLPPPRAFELDHFHQAQRRCEDEGWPELARPIWGGRHRVEALTRARPEDERLVEAHPELSFTAMHQARGGEGPLEHYGDAYEALVERAELLEAEGWPVDALEDEDCPPRLRLDAAATAWTAHRVAAGEAFTVPADPPEDPRTGAPVCFHV